MLTSEHTKTIIRDNHLLISDRFYISSLYLASL